MKIISNYPKNDNNEYRKGAGYYIPLVIALTCFLTGFITIAYLITTLPYYLSDTPQIEAEPIQQEFIVPEKKVEEEKPEPVVHLTDDDILVAVAMSEAGNQDVLGMAFVIMTVLNRCDYYNATVEQIVNTPNAYSYPYYGTVSHNAYIALDLAKEYRHIFKPIAWFQTGSYPVYGEPAFKWGDHYFCYIPDMEVG